MTYRPAVVHWIDTSSPLGWQTVADLDGDTCVVRSVAWVLPEGTRVDHLTLAQDVHPEGDVNGVTHIPWAMVRRVDFLDDPLTDT